MGDYEDATALISDVHANNDGLEVVIQDIDYKNIKKIVCLGDIIGYGNQMATTADRFEKGWKSKDGWTYPFDTVEGNHDRWFIQLFKGETKPGTLKGLYRVKPDAVDSWVKAVHRLQVNPKRAHKRIEFLSSLPRSTTIADGIRGTHAFENPRTGLMVYTVPFNLGIKYGIDEDIIQDPKDVLNNPNIFTEDVFAYFLGHTHVPFACGIKKSGEYVLLVPKGTKELLETVREQKLTDDDPFAEMGIDVSEDTGSIVEMTAYATEFPLRDYERVIVNTGSVARSKIEDQELFSRIEENEGRRKAWTDIIARGKTISTAFYTILRKDLVVEFHQINYETKIK